MIHFRRPKPHEQLPPAVRRAAVILNIKRGAQIGNLAIKAKERVAYLRADYARGIADVPYSL
ncbi:MAG: hypothetical protein ABIU09_08055 [Pyrinomonadaceae bacterium]